MDGEGLEYNLFSASPKTGGEYTIAVHTYPRIAVERSAQERIVRFIEERA